MLLFLILDPPYRANIFRVYEVVFELLAEKKKVPFILLLYYFLA